jgi:hypothetical protein
MVAKYLTAGLAQPVHALLRSDPWAIESLNRECTAVKRPESERRADAVLVASTLSEKLRRYRFSVQSHEFRVSLFRSELVSPQAVALATPPPFCPSIQRQNPPTAIANGPSRRRSTRCRLRAGIHPRRRAPRYEIHARQGQHPVQPKAFLAR